MDMSEVRNNFGFPVADKLAAARKIAAGAAIRKEERECKCFRCIEADKEETLQSVMRILSRVSK